MYIKVIKIIFLIAIGGRVFANFESVFKELTPVCLCREIKLCYLEHFASK